MTVSRVPSRTGRRRAALAAPLVLVLLWLGAPAWASVGGEVAGLINGARADAGLGALQRDAAMDGVAQAWAENLASSGELAHNPSYAEQIPGGWQAAAENVAMNSAPSASAMHGQLMNSPGHRANILGDFTRIGVGYATDGAGAGWLVEVFAAYGSAPPPPPPPPDPSSAPAPSDDPTGAAPSSGPADPGPTTPAVPEGWLAMGSTGPQVTQVQESLAALGYDAVADGTFGRQTRAALLAFQSDADLAADGMAGPVTLAALETAVADVDREPASSSEEPTGDATEDPDPTPAAPAPTSVEAVERESLDVIAAEASPAARLEAADDGAAGLAAPVALGVLAVVVLALAGVALVRRRRAAGGSSEQA